MRIEKYSFGVGDRFAHQAEYQLAAFQKLADAGIDVVPVWNKSNREHMFVGSQPQSVQAAAAAAVKKLGWQKAWYVDADHINLSTVDKYLSSSNFFTLDVADWIGKPASDADVQSFISRHAELIGRHDIDGLREPLSINHDQVAATVRNYSAATIEAGKIYRHIAAKLGADQFIPEVSMDETNAPQTPPELLVILALLADQQIPLQTIAPKFTGRFNKGVNYVGDLAQFEREFDDDLAILEHASKTYGLPPNLKLSVHSGSDKFDLYPIIREALERTGAGVHLKTAGTTWLEELIGLAEAGGDGLAMTKDIYNYASSNVETLCAPYASVIDINPAKLPRRDAIAKLTGPEMAALIRHDPSNQNFNSDVRQLLHVSFKLAAKPEYGFMQLLEQNEQIVGKQVTDNIFDRHLKPLFLG